jgi:hypothetical protein
MLNTRTDLALEAHELYRETESRDHAPGVVVDTDKLDKVTVTRVHVQNE